MSNACRNSLLIIVAVIVCVATPLLGIKASAQSDLLFPVTGTVSISAPNLETVFGNTTVSVERVVKDVSITAPEIEVVFAGHPRYTEPVQETPVVTNLRVSSETTVYIEEVPVEGTFIEQAELHFPVKRKRAYTAPNIEVVFSGQESTKLTSVSERTAYTAPDVEVVFTGHALDTTGVKRTADKKISHKKEQRVIAKEIARIRERVAILQQRVDALKKAMRADDFGCGSCGSSVKKLQQFLNRNGFMLAALGAGSPGQETSYFGPRTLAAVKNFQEANAIPVTGVVDAQTRNLITSIEHNALDGSTVQDCVTLKKKTDQTKKYTKKKEQKEVTRNDQTDQNGDKSESGNFFTRLFKKIADFFRNLFA